MRARDSALAVAVWCLFVACGKSASVNPSDGQTSDAGQGTGGASTTGGSSSGGQATGGAGGANAGGSSGAGRGGTGPTGGSAGDAGESNAGQAGEGAAGAGGARTCTVDGAILISSEADLQAFAAQGCAVLDGSLTITSPTLASLDTLAPSTLRAITGTLRVDDNPVLDNLEGFSGLEEIGGSFILQSSYVGDLDGLETLRSIGASSDTDALVIANNPRLSDVRPLSGVTRLLSSVSVASNAALTSLEGIGRLTATSSVDIVNNGLLSEIGGLADLEETQNLTIVSNPSLLGVEFPNLARAGSLTITSNGLLESVSLPVLESAETLTIAGNPSLETLGTLDALMSVGMLFIAGNTLLPQCFVDALDARLQACNASCGGNDVTAVCN